MRPALLLAGNADRRDVQKQLSRWTQAGRLYQLRRGLYALAPPFQKVKPHPFLVANRLVHGSYVSCLSALAYYDLIPEEVPVTHQRDHCAGRRAGTHPWEDIEFRHIQSALLHGYISLEVSSGSACLRRYAGEGTARLDLSSSQMRTARLPDASCACRTWSSLTWTNCAAGRAGPQSQAAACRRWSSHWPPPRPRSTRRYEGLYLAELGARPARPPLQGRNVAREYLQARLLGGLQRAGAMIPLAFPRRYGAALLYASPRYSEDLDFALERLERTQEPMTCGPI